MSGYDDDRVIALLRESVPPPPDTAPDRITAIRQRAGSQRTAVWTQTLGVAASLVLVLGFAAVATGAGRGGPVEPTARPLDALMEAFGKQTSLRFEARLRPVGDIDTTGSSLSQAQIAALITSEATGAATKDGDVQVDGDLSFLDSFGLGEGEQPKEAETHWRLVGGVLYRSMPPDPQHPGKAWLASPSVPAGEGGVQLDRALRVAAAVAEDVRYVRNTTVRDTPVAEYRLTVPERYANGQALHVTFALDAQDRLRRIATEFSLLRLMAGGEELPPGGPGDMRVRVEVELFGYGDRVQVEAPPAGAVLDQDAYYNEQTERMSECMQNADSQDEMQACVEQSGLHDGTRIGTAQPVQAGCEPSPETGEPDPDCVPLETGWTSVGGTPPSPASEPPPASTASPAP